MTIKHRPGDPRREPPLCDPWDGDTQPGTGLARAIVYMFAFAVVALALWSRL